MHSSTLTPTLHPRNLHPQSLRDHTPALDSRPSIPLPPSVLPPYEPKNLATRSRSFSNSVRRVWHSQTVCTDHPRRRNARFVRRSRAALRSSLASQYRRRAVGTRHRPQWCICQKQRDRERAQSTRWNQSTCDVSIVAIHPRSGIICGHSSLTAGPRVSFRRSPTWCQLVGNAI